MKGMNRCWFSIRALLSLTLWLAPAGVAGTIDQVLADRLSQTPPEEKVPIIIYLQAQVDLDEMETLLQQMVPPGERVPIELRYQTIITALQEIAEQEQPSVLQRIEQYEQREILSDIETYWIRNIINSAVTVSRTNLAP